MFDYCILCVHIVPYTYDWPQQMQVFIGWVRLGSEECTYIPYNRAARFMPFSIDQKTSRIRNFYIKQIYGNSYYSLYLIGFQNRLLQTALVQINLNSTTSTPPSMRYRAWNMEHGAIDPKAYRSNVIRNFEGICILKGNYWLHLIMTAVLNLYSSLRK